MQIMVSISCITYNHEDYIEDALDGFLMQKTNFPYEILVHDDASIDRTSDIIKEYELEYPDLVKPVFQTENQYSKGVKVGCFNKKRARGKYIAICEGDDYWIDPYKLQKQVDFLESNPKCSMCYHAAAIFDARLRKRVGIIRPYNKNLILNGKKLFYGGGNVCPTASIVYKKICMDSPPSFYYSSPVGDHMLALILSNKGEIAYLDELMSVRNLWVPNSWQSTYYEKKDAEKIQHYSKMIRVLEEFNLYSNRKWEKDVNCIILEYKNSILTIACETKEDNAVLQNEIRMLTKKVGFFNGIKIKAREKSIIYKHLAKIKHTVLDRRKMKGIEKERY